ncbi:MAG: hypothetical protein II265_00815 [Clostridia bacterium]|nr:hypothetical protein [Clostridia bacterium]
MHDFICGVIVFLLGVIVSLAVCTSIWDDAKAAHHKDAYNEFGQLTCEICKALVEKGAK